MVGLLHVPPGEEQISDIIDHAVSMIRTVREASNLPEMLYHYTNGDGLIGIAEKKELWLTNVGYMNDTEEYIMSAKMIRDYCITAHSMPARNEAQGRVLTHMIKRLNKAIEGEVFACFVACLSECKDELSQWRGYSGDQNKFALGMDPIHLFALCDAWGNELDNGNGKWLCYIAKVAYDRPTQHKLVQSMMEFVLLSYPKHEQKAKPIDPEQYAQDWAEKYLQYASLVAPIMKHEKFEREQEWRLIVTPFTKKDVKYRNRKNLIAPYLKMGLFACSMKKSDREWMHPVRTLWIGPSSHKAENLRAAEHMMDGYGYHDVEPILSDVPYRDLG